LKAIITLIECNEKDAKGDTIEDFETGNDMKFAEVGTA